MEKYIEALQKYFKLKENYDNQFNNKKHVIITNDEYTIKEKRKHIQNIKMKCIGCGKLVGTIFSDKNRTYSAVCGNRATPCNLDISIKKGTILNAETSYLNELVSEQDVRNKIITTKLDVLFGLINDDEMEEIFQSLKEEHTDLSEYLTKLKLIINDGKETRTEIVKLNTIKLYENLEEQKELLESYMKDTAPEKMRDIIELYVTDIIPTLKMIADNKYQYRAMEKCSIYFDNTIDKCLIQKKNVIEHFEVVTEDPEVVAFKLK